jgi:hypothetical protein
MDIEHWLMIAITLLAIVCFAGFFKTKTEGFGRYTTSVLLLMIALFLATLLLVGDRIDAALFGHIAFAVVGFAGGLFVTKEQ